MKIPFLSRLLEIKEEQLRIEKYKLEQDKYHTHLIIERLDEILTKLQRRKKWNKKQ